MSIHALGGQTWVTQTKSEKKKKWALGLPLETFTKICSMFTRVAKTYDSWFLLISVPIIW